jgi:hypothetical protein
MTSGERYTKALAEADAAWAEYCACSVPVYNDLGPHDDPYWCAQQRVKTAEYELGRLES